MSITTTARTGGRCCVVTLPSPEWTAMLAELFKQAEAAGWGIADGASFEAYPGLEDAAADYIQALVDQMTDY